MTELIPKKELLIKYVSVVFELEKNKFRQQKAIEQVEGQIQRLIYPCILEHPEAPKTLPTRRGSVFFMVLGIVLSIFMLILIAAGGDSRYIILMGLGAIYFILHASDIRQKKRKITEENKKAEQSYHEAMDVYNTAVLEGKAKLRLAEFLKERLVNMNAQMIEMENDLDRAYSYNIIASPYRNLVAVSSFYEYLSQSRCDDLTGHKGAYNIYNLESRLNMIVTKLDDISRKLNSIKDNQFMLYSAITESNQKIEQLQSAVENTNKELSRLADQATISNTQLAQLTYNTELVKFNTEQTRREVELRNRMDGILTYGWMNASSTVLSRGF